MNRFFSRVMMILFVGCAGSAIAQTLRGTVVGDDGKPVAATIHFIPSTGAGGPLTYTASTASGSFSVPDLAPGTYEVCINVPSGGYVNPCHWPDLKVSFTQSASTAAPLQLVAHKGSIVTVQLSDPAGILAAHPTSPVIVGVFIPRGPFYPMLRSSQSSGTSAYTLTIPYNTNALLYISSPDFSAADETGKALQTAGQSFLLHQSSTAADPVFSFNITGTKGN